MGRLRLAILLVAATIVFASPCTAKVVKFEILKVESLAFEGRIFGSVGTYDRILARATIAVSPGDPAATIAKATQQLVQDRLLLDEDAALFITPSN